MNVERELAFQADSQRDIAAWRVDYMLLRCSAAQWSRRSNARGMGKELLLTTPSLRTVTGLTSRADRRLGTGR